MNPVRRRLTSCRLGEQPCRGGMDEFRQVHRPREGIRAGCAEPGPAGRPSAVRHRPSPESPARRSGRSGRGLDPARRRSDCGRPECDRAHTFKAPKGVRRRCRAGLSRAGSGAGLRLGREDRRQGRRRVRHGRAPAAGAGHGALGRRRPRAERGGRQSDHAEPGHQRHSQGPHRRQRFGRAGL